MPAPAEVAHYYMNDNAPSDVVEDASGNGNHGTANRNTEDFNAAGRVNGALDFNGTDDDVDCNSALIGTGAKSIAFWMYLDGWGESGDNRVLAEGDGAGNYFMAYAQFQGEAQHRFRFTSDRNSYADSAAASIGTGAWYHVVLTRDAAGVANIYINGALSGDADQDSGTPTVGEGNLFIGNDSGGDNTFDGPIDDVRIYDAELTAAQVSLLYNGGSGTEETLQALSGNRRRRMILLGTAA